MNAFRIVWVAEPGWGEAAPAALAEGFCPIHRSRLTPATNCVGVPAGWCGICELVWYPHRGWVNICSGPGMPAGHCTPPEQLAVPA